MKGMKGEKINKEEEKEKVEEEEEEVEDIEAAFEKVKENYNHSSIISCRFWNNILIKLEDWGFSVLRTTARIIKLSHIFSWSSFYL